MHVFPARFARIPVLLILLLVVSCALRDPSGTNWTTVLTVEAQPETLRVSRILESSSVVLEGDSLLVFRQELVSGFARLGDSLSWEGLGQSLRLEVGRLDLHGLGQTQSQLPFLAAWPQYASLLGQQAQIDESAETEVTLALPDWPEMEWVAYAHSIFQLEVSHRWPFTLDWLEVELLNSLGASLGSCRLEPAQGLPPDLDLSGTLVVSGLLTRASHLVLRLRHRPMTAPALIDNQSLTLRLEQSTGLADSARAVLPALDMVWSDSLQSASRLRILHALTEPARLGLTVRSELPVPLQLDLTLPQLRDGGGEGLSFALQLPARGQAQRLEEPGPLELEDERGLEWLQVLGTARTSTTGTLGTMRAGDGLSVELELDPLALESFDGWFVEDLRVPIETSETEVADWPVELTALDLSELPMRLELINLGGVDLQGHFELEALDSRLGRADTTFVSDLGVLATDTLLQVEGADRLVSRLPQRLVLQGHYTVPAGSRVQLERPSRVGVAALSLPARARVGALRWQSLPERHTDALPAEAMHLRLQGEVENRLPAGGRVSGWVSPSLAGERVPLFELEIQAAEGAGAELEAVTSPLELELGPAALEVLQGGEWWLWYEFQALSGETAVEVRADQWLAVRASIQVQVDVELEGGP